MFKNKLTWLMLKRINKRKHLHCDAHISHSQVPQLNSVCLRLKPTFLETIEFFIAEGLLEHSTSIILRVFLSISINEINNLTLEGTTEFCYQQILYTAPKGGIATIFLTQDCSK